MSFNPYRKLLGLLPQRPLQVGDIMAADSGVYDIELPGGGMVKGRGTGYAVGARVFVRDGLIEGEAPALTLVEIDI